MEILAPAGNKDSFLAAVNSGANAVYLSGKSFGARASAQNFNLEEIAEVVKYAHLRGIKVYITVNTLIADSEIQEALRFVVSLYNAGVDSIIIQDWGLISLIRKYYPQIPLNASTQMTFMNSAACRFGENEGFRRVILAREVSLSDMATINEKVDVETEVFVHGAICVCFSGQCLFSSLVGGRSGNRGRCAQPCRLKYKLTSKRGKEIHQSGHLLSPKDLKGIEHLEAIEASGVVSAKIEGRMKRPEYVATVVKAYADANVGKEISESDLKQAFNRDFTSAYMVADPGKDFMSYERPNNRGTSLGRIESLNADEMILKTDAELKVGDGVEIWVSKGGRQGFTVEELSILGNKKITVSLKNANLQIENIRVGDRVFKTFDAELSDNAKMVYTAYDTKEVTMKFIGRIGENPELEVVCGEKTASSLGDFEIPLAQKRPADFESIHKQLSRLGGTGWTLANLAVEIDDGIMLPASVLNQMRRDAMEELEAMILADFSRDHLGNVYLDALDKRPKGKKTCKISVVVDTYAAAKQADDNGADYIYWNATAWRAPHKVDLEEIEKIAKIRNNVYVKLPTIAMEDELAVWKNRLRTYKKLGFKGIVAANMWAIEMVKNIGWDCEIIGDFALNTFNSQAAEYWGGKGLSRVGISQELSFEQIEAMQGATQKEAQIFGNLEMMVSRHCPIGAVCGGKTAEKKCGMPCMKERYQLQDEKGFTFPVKADEFCRSHIYNGFQLNLVDDIYRFMKSPVDVVRLDLSHYRDHKVGAITGIINQALQTLANGVDVDKAKVKANLSEVAAMQFTKGHYYRGVE